MLSLGKLQKDAPLRWAAIVVILVFFAVCTVVFLVILIAAIPYWTRARRTTAMAETAELANAIGIHLHMTGRMPACLDDLRVPQPKNDGDPIVEFMVDPWGHPFGFTLDGPGAATVTCFGADGEPGGTGADEDIVVHWPTAVVGSPR